MRVPTSVSPILLPPLSTYFIFRYSGRMKITNVIAVNTITAINLNQRINSSDGWRVYVKKKKKKKLQLNRGEWKIGGGGFHRWNVSRNRISYIEPCYIYVFYIHIYIYIFSFVSRPLYYRNPMKTLWKFETRRDGVGQLREVNTRRSVRNYERSVASTVLDDTKRFISNLFRKSRRHLDTFNLPR